MKNNRVKNTKRNAFWGSFEKVLNILFQFITRTVLIKALGEQFLGLSSLFTSLLQVLNMAELGFSSAIIFNLYKPIAENDKETVCALMNVYKKIYRYIGIFVIFIGLILIPFLKYIIKDTIPANYNVTIMYLIYLFNAGISYFMFAYKNCLLEAHQRNDIISRVKLCFLFFQSIYQILVLVVFKNYYLYIIIYPFTTIFNNVICAIVVKKIYPEYICKGSLSSDIKKKLKLNVIGLSIGKICIVSRNSLDNIFLSAFINLSAVAIYNNYYYIFTALNTFLSVVVSSMSASVGNSVAVDSKEKNYNDYIKFNFIYMWIAGWCSITLLCLYQPFMEIWMGKNMLFPIETVSLICIYFYCLKLGDIRSIYSNAAGLFWESKNYVIFEAIMNGILNYLLGKMFGINGIIIATNITIVFINFIFGTRVLFKNYFKNSLLIKFYMKNIYYALITIFSGGIMLFISGFINVFPVLKIVIMGILCLIIPNILFIVFYSRSNEYKSGKQFLIKLLKK